MECHQAEPPLTPESSRAPDGTRPPATLVHELLGSASVFASVVATLVNETLSSVSGEHSLTLGQLRFLELVAHGEESGVSDIARSVGISNAAVSRTLDKLVELGLMTRRPGTDDRRTVRLGLTEAGDAVLADYRTRIESALIGTLTGGGTEGLASMTASLDRMTHALLDARIGDPPPCRGCIACSLFRRADCPLGAGRPHAACHAGPSGPTSTLTTA